VTLKQDLQGEAVLVQGDAQKMTLEVYCFLLHWLIDSAEARWRKDKHESTATVGKTKVSMMEIGVKLESINNTACGFRVNRRNQRARTAMMCGTGKLSGERFWKAF
jgi:hypothetical protein